MVQYHIVVEISFLAVANIQYYDNNNYIWSMEGTYLDSAWLAIVFQFTDISVSFALAADCDRPAFVLND